MNKNIIVMKEPCAIDLTYYDSEKEAVVTTLIVSSKHFMYANPPAGVSDSKLKCRF